MRETIPGRAFRALLRSVPAGLRSRMLRPVLDTASETDKFRLGLPSVAGLLENIRQNGFTPGGIVDIGANMGNWSRMARAVFPDAPIAMFDGNPLHEPALAAAVRDVGAASHTMAVLGPQEKEKVVFYSIGPGSGVLPELTSFPREEQQLPMRRLDDLIDQSAVGNALRKALLIKLDVQGYELEVLRGGPSTLARAELVILETSLLPYNEGGATFADVLAFMTDAGFVSYDFCGQFRRSSDWALCQTDVAFVRRDNPLRGAKKFWRNEPS